MNHVQEKPTYSAAMVQESADNGIKTANRTYKEAAKLDLREGWKC